MRPAFSSTKQAAAFLLLLAVVLLGPVIAGKNLLPAREQSYAIQGWENAPFPWLHQQIFEEKQDIDIAFVGSSLMMWGIDTPYVQEKLSEQLGRPAVVRTICWGGTGYDALYFITQDLLAHRKVRLLVFYDENNFSKTYRNSQAPLWFRYGDNAGALDGLPLGEKAHFYFSAIIGLPRNLLALMSPIEPMPVISSTPNAMESYFHAINPATRLGSVFSRLECTPEADAVPYTPFTPQGMAKPDDVCIYSGTNASHFEFLDEHLPVWQEHFARAFARTAKQHGCKLVMLTLPQLDTSRPATLREREFWPDFLNANVTMLGIPPAKFFEGISDGDIYRLYYNAGRRGGAFNSHLNGNGQPYFTHLVTPALLKIYETSTNR